MVVEYMDRAQGPTMDFFAQNLSLKQTCLTRGHLGCGGGRGDRRGHAPGVTCAMVTHRLQLVLWPPWPQPVQNTSRGRYCVKIVRAVGPVLTSETTKIAPVAVL